MPKVDLILIGAGGHAASCIDVIEQHGQLRVAGLVGLENQLNEQCFGYEVIGSDLDLPRLAETYEYALITLGQIITPEHRMRLYHKILQLGFKLPTIIAPSSYVSPHVSIGNGSIIMHGSIVNAGVKIGNNCIINSRALVEHNVIVEDHCHIATGAILNGEVTVGTGSFIGSGAIVKQGVSIGENSIIGMGLSVRHDLSNLSRFIGLED